MAKNLKLHIKNTQLAEAINLRGLKAKLSRKKGQPIEEEKPILEQEEISRPEEEAVSAEESSVQAIQQEETMAALPEEPSEPVSLEQEPLSPPPVEEVAESVAQEPPSVIEEYREPTPPVEEPVMPVPLPPLRQAPPPPFLSASRSNPDQLGPVFGREPLSARPLRREPPEPKNGAKPTKVAYEPLRERRPPAAKAGGEARVPQRGEPSKFRQGPGPERGKEERGRPPRGEGHAPRTSIWPEAGSSKEEHAPRRLGSEGAKKPKAKTSGDGRQKGQDSRSFFKRSEGHGEDSRLRRGIASEDEGETAWRKKRSAKGFRIRDQQQEVSRPTRIAVRLPITVKDLAAEMKIKASQLISSLFMQGVVVTLNDLLADETMVQLLGNEVGCEIGIDTSEEKRLRITDKTIAEEIAAEDPSHLVLRPPVVTFMGHVDHGKTTLIDAIRKAHTAASEVGAITQHIGAFTCMTDHGQIAIIDTPGHEAFTAMRERGASLTDIVVLVIAGDEGIKEQTVEALQQAKESKATIIVAITKSDKPNFDQERVFRQLADYELLPEAWGGRTIAVSCSSVTHEGINELLEMIALQSEVLELKANLHTRARGTVIESEMCKGIGAVATVLVQNGTLHLGDCLVFGSTWARVKAMRNDVHREMTEAGPSTPVRISGLSGLPEAGEEFIVVKNEKEARDIAESRHEGLRQMAFQAKRRVSLENMMEKASAGAAKKVLTLLLRADVQGSLEALKTALLKIQSQKVELNIISCGIGEVSESDIQLAAASRATIIGFHTGIEAHAEPMVKELGVSVRLHNVIYHAQDDVRELMRSTLDKIAEQQERGKAEVKTVFKSSQLGYIAGCMVIDGTLTRNCSVRVRRGNEILWHGPIASLKRFKDDVKEVSKGAECGIVLQGFSSYQEGDVLEGYETVYHEQDL